MMRNISVTISEHLVINGSRIMGDSTGGGRFQGNRVFNSMPCSNYGKIENETEMQFRRLVALDESNGFTQKLLYALFVFLLALVILLIVK